MRSLQMMRLKETFVLHFSDGTDRLRLTMSNSSEDSSLVLDTRLEELDERIDQIEQETLRLQAALSAVDGRLYQLEAVAVTY
jgi:uncharacterized protein YhaN